jgi:hypothetical protein
MRLDEAKQILNDSGYIMEAVKNEKETLEIPVCRKGNNVVFWRVWTKVDLDKDEHVIDMKHIYFGHPDKYISGRFDADDGAVPDSATRSPSAAAAYIAKDGEWGSVTAEDFKKALADGMKRLNDNRIDDRKRRAKATVTNQFKEEFDALLKKYGAKVKGSCWSAYDPAQGNVWVEIEGGDDLDLMDLDDHGEYKAE